MTTKPRVAPQGRTDPRSLINYDRYPIDAPESQAYRDVAAAARRSLQRSGSLVLEGFLSTSGLALLRAEAEALATKAFHSKKMGSPYGVVNTDGLADDHPYRILSPTDRHGVAYHMMRDTALGDLYRWPPMRQLVAAVTGNTRLYLHEDPSNALVLQIYRPGGHLAWHFDRARFSCIIHLQAAEAGGVFEQVPGLRSPDDECFDDVRAVLLGDRTRVAERRAEPGTFSIFRGHCTLHRVTPVEGERSRISLVLSYEEQPGAKLDVATRKLFFGPSAPDEP